MSQILFVTNSKRKIILKMTIPKTTERVLGALSSGLNAVGIGLSFLGPEGKVAAAVLSTISGGLQAANIELEYANHQINRSVMAEEQSMNAIQTVGSIVGFGMAAKEEIQAIDRKEIDRLIELHTDITKKQEELERVRPLFSQSSLPALNLRKSRNKSTA